MLDEQAGRFCVTKMRRAYALRGMSPAAPRSIRNEEGAKVQTS